MGGLLGPGQAGSLCCAGLSTSPRSLRTRAGRATAAGLWEGPRDARRWPGIGPASSLSGPIRAPPSPALLILVPVLDLRPQLQGIPASVLGRRRSNFTFLSTGLPGLRVEELAALGVGMCHWRADLAGASHPRTCWP